MDRDFSCPCDKKLLRNSHVIDDQNGKLYHYFSKIPQMVQELHCGTSGGHAGVNKRERIPIPNQEAKKVADALVEIGSGFGVPIKLHSDKGRNFDSEVLT